MTALGGGTLEVRAGAASPASSGHVLVVVDAARAACPAAYPRDPAARRRRPW